MSISDMFKKVAQKQANTSTGVPDQPSIGGDFQTLVSDIALVHGSEAGPSTSRAKGITAYFSNGPSEKKEEIGSTKRTSLYSDLNTNNSAVSERTKDSDDSNPGNSFFKNFLMKKKLTSASDLSENETLKKHLPSDRTYTDEDSCDAALSFLASILDASTDEREEQEDRPTNTQELEHKPIKLSQLQEEYTAEESAYDETTDEDNSIATEEDTNAKATNTTITITKIEKNSTFDAKSINQSCSDKFNESSNSLNTNSELSNRKSTSVNGSTISTTGKASSAHPTKSVPPSSSAALQLDPVVLTSVSELFPDLGDVDESLLPHLPPDIRRAVTAALQQYRAEQTGKKAIRKTGIWKYMRRDNCVDQRELTDAYKSKKSAADAIPEKSVRCSSQTSTTDISISAPEIDIRKFMKDKQSSSGSHVNRNKDLANKGSPRPIFGIGISSKTTLLDKPLSSNTINISTSKENYQSLPRINKHVDRKIVDDVSGSIPDASLNCTSDAPIASDSEESAGDMIECDRCKRMIRLTAVAEHFDYHVAMDMQSEINGTSGTDPAVNKRKLSIDNKTEKKRNKTIDSFFKK